MKKAIITRSYYIPWIGYFNFIQYVDEIYFYDEFQYTKNDWRNRNQIITPLGKKWLSKTVLHGYLGQPLKEVEIAYSNWSRRHYEAIKSCSGKAEIFKMPKHILQEEFCSDCYIGTLQRLPLHLKLVNEKEEFASESIIEFYNK